MNNKYDIPIGQLEGRTWLIKALVGSHNYNLNTPESDKDYKVFFLPTFEDLYTNTIFNIPQIVTEEVDFDFHDIRKLPKQWWKASINFLEILFTSEGLINSHNSPKLDKLIFELLEMKEDIARMNLPYLFNACIGMHITKMKQIDKGTSGTQHLVDQFGYDTKQAMHSFRPLQFLQRYEENNFTNFKKAIWYEKGDIDREILEEIKGGAFNRSEIEALLTAQKKYVEATYGDLYLSEQPNEETNRRVQEIIKEIIKYSVHNELMMKEN